MTIAERNSPAGAAHLTTLRGLYLRTRLIGLAMVVGGAIALVSFNFMPGAPAWAMPAGFAALLVGWLVLAFVIYQRTAYARAHPFKAES